MQFCKLSLSALLWILFSAGNIVAQALIPGELVQRYTFNGDTLQVLTDEVLAECSLPACDDLTVTDRYQDMPLGVGYFCGGPLQLLDEDRKRPDPFELGAEVAFPAEQRLLFACADRFSIALSNTEGEVRRFGQVFALNFTGPPIISPYHDGIADFPDVEVVIVGLIDGTSLIIDYRDEDKIRAHHTRIRLLVPGLSEPLARVRQNGELRVFFETNNGWRVYDMRTDTVLVCDAMNQRFAVNGAAIRAEGSGRFHLIETAELCASHSATGNSESPIPTVDYPIYWSSYAPGAEGDRIELCYFEDRLCENFKLEHQVSSGSGIVAVLPSGGRYVFVVQQDDTVAIVSGRRLVD